MMRRKSEAELTAMEAFENMPIAQLTVRQLRELITGIVDGAPSRAKKSAAEHEERMRHIYPDSPLPFPRLY